MAVALITGGSRGLGLALGRALATRDRPWRLAIDARGHELDAAAAELSALTDVVAIRGDVADEAHRVALVDAARSLGGLDLLVNNASLLGPSPQPHLAEYGIDVLEDVYRVNVLAPLRLFQLALPLLEQASGRVLDITSDAAVEPYEGWGGYGSSKAALDQLTKILGAEHPQLRVYAVDPGDMNTQMHREAEPGVDLSGLPGPEVLAPAFLHLIDRETAPAGRFEAPALVRTLSRALEPALS